VVEIDVAGNNVTLKHEAIPALKWAAMEMEFVVEPGALPKALKPGDRVQFNVMAGKPGEFVITRIESVSSAKPAAPVPGPTPPRPAPNATPEAHKH
jgi:hypothetical protein